MDWLVSWFVCVAVVVDDEAQFLLCCASRDRLSWVELHCWWDRVKVEERTKGRSRDTKGDIRSRKNYCRESCQARGRRSNRPSYVRSHWRRWCRLARSLTMAQSSGYSIITITAGVCACVWAASGGGGGARGGRGGRGGGGGKQLGNNREQTDTTGATRKNSPSSRDIMTRSRISPAVYFPPPGLPSFPHRQPTHT